MTVRCEVVLIGAIAALSSVASAQAHDDLASPQAPAVGRAFRGYAAVGVLAHDESGGRVRGASLDVGLAFGIGDDAVFAVDWGVAFAAAHMQGEYVGSTVRVPYVASRDRVEARNAVARLRWAPRVADVRLEVGLGFAVPTGALAQAPSNTTTQAEYDASVLTHRAWWGANGLAEPWRYRPERAEVFAPVGIHLTPAAGVRLGILGTMGLALPVLGGSVRSVRGDLEIAAELTLEASEAVRVGGRVAVFAWDIDDPTTGVTVAPWLLVRSGGPLDGFVRLDVGAPFEDDTVAWGLHVGLALATLDAP